MVFNRSKTRPGTTRRVRMLGHDYSYPGYYFITMCTHERQQLFGEIRAESMELSSSGNMIQDLIDDIELRFRYVAVDSSVVMPNHVHILLGISVGLNDERGDESVSDVVKWFKSASVRRYGLAVKNETWPRYSGRLWQAGFHDHIVRNDKELETLRNYIANNVYMWEKDTFSDGRIYILPSETDAQRGPVDPSLGDRREASRRRVVRVEEPTTLRILRPLYPHHSPTARDGSTDEVRD